MLNIDNSVTNFLQALGLSSTEQKLYLTGLSTPEIGVTQLVDATGINRTTAYHALATLRQKGLASEAKVQGRLVYTMTKPDELDTYLARKKATLEKQKQQLIELKGLFPSAEKTQAQDTAVEKFEGIEGVKNAIEKALYCRSRQWEIIAPKDNFFSQAEPAYSQYFMETRRSRGIRARSLWEKKPGTARNLSLEELLFRQPRYLPEAFRGKFKSVIIIFDDKALFITSVKDHSAVLIHSKEITGTLHVLFQGLWATADTPVEKTS